MRKLKKINGYLVVRFNDREKREYPHLGSFGVIDAEQYTGDLDFDLDAMEYIDADLMEVAIEQARGLDAEKDYSDQPPVYTVTVETAGENREKTVDPKLLVMLWKRQLETQIKSRYYSDIDPRTAVHELNGYKAALRNLGLMGEEEAATELNTFGDACAFYDDDGHRVNMMLPSKAGLAIVSAHDYEEGEVFTGCTVQTLKCRRCGRESFAWSKEPAPGQEETLAYICDEVCKYREGRTQEELDAICAKCRVDRWAGALPTLTPQDGATDAERDTFTHAHSAIWGCLMKKDAYTLGLALAEKCPDNDCKIYLNIFNMARELDKALDKAEGYPATVLQKALRDRLHELKEMYNFNYAIKQFKEEMKK